VTPPVVGQRPIQPSSGSDDGVVLDRPFQFGGNRFQHTQVASQDSVEQRINDGVRHTTDYYGQASGGIGLKRLARWSR
jgi:hypothetical protein